MASRRPLDRFLPSDPRTEEPYRLTPQLALRVGILGALVLIVFAVLFLRLWALQVLSGDQYLNAAQNNQLRKIRVEAPRGAIVDREGRPLVTNVPGTIVQIWTADLPEQGRYAMLKRLAGVLDVPLRRLTRELEARRGDPLTPITVKTAVKEEHARYLLEHRREFPGVSVTGTYLRNYERRALAAHILGSVGEISPEELDVLEAKGYRAGDRIGKGGVEAAFDTYLRGRPGTAHLRVDSLGRPQSDLQLRVQPRAGNAVRLTIDARLQRAAEQALQEGIRLAWENDNWSANGGAIVALDPRDGAVLAIASNPTYKPSLFVGRVDERKLAALADEDANTPLLNRAIAGQYPPGSTFKPVTALAAMQEHLLSPHEPISCTPYKEYGLDEQRFRNWNPFVNEAMTLSTALAESCDTYFYDVAYRFYTAGEERGIDWWSRLQKWARIFGFGEPARLDIGGEQTGLLPTPAWRKATYDNPIDRAWNPGDLIQLAIGQKDMLVTPLQMARFYAVLANGGRLVTPYLVSAVEQPGANGGPSIVLRPFAPPPPEPTGIDSGALAVVREGLLQATTHPEGTSSGVFGSFPVPVAGKTGTAEKWSSKEGRMLDQSWWCGWGPFDGGTYAGKSPIVVCALIENGGFGGEAAAPAALRVFEAWFGRKASVIAEVASD